MRLIPIIYLRRLLILKRLLKILKVWIMEKKINIHHLLYLESQARSHLTGLVQYLGALLVSELPGGAKPNLNVVVARQQLQTLEQALTRDSMHLVFRALLQIGFHHWSLLGSVIAFLSCWVITLLLLLRYSNKYFYLINPSINPCSPSPVYPVRYPL